MVMADPAAGVDAMVGIRFRYVKLGKVRFTSHRDVARMWERALRRSGLPVAWSEGFAPRPLLSFGLALPTGCESLAEYLDVRLSAPPDPIPSGTFSALLPEGITVVGSAPLAHRAGSLQEQVTSCCWELEVLGLTVEELRERIGLALAAPRIPVHRERKGRLVEDDLRPSILSLSLGDAMASSLQGTQAPARRAGAAGTGQPLRIRAELATRPRGVRPPELLNGLATDLAMVRARRTNQWIERDGARWEPLAVDGERAMGDVAWRAHGCAS
jgi:radical SAM-linked protein